MQSNSAKFPCPYAECYRDSNGYWIIGKLRTIQGCRNNYLEYQEYIKVTGDTSRKSIKND